MAQIDQSQKGIELTHVSPAVQTMPEPNGLESPFAAQSRLELTESDALLLEDGLIDASRCGTPARHLSAWQYAAKGQSEEVKADLYGSFLQWQ